MVLGQSPAGRWREPAAQWGCAEASQSCRLLFRDSVLNIFYFIFLLLFKESVFCSMWGLPGAVCILAHTF